MKRRPKPETPATPRAKLWIEQGGRSILNDAGADLLEQIEATGSLSEAARRLRFSYRRAWMLLDEMNRTWSGPLVRTAIGGKDGGGATLTDLGGRVLRSFRDLQLQVEAAIDQEVAAFRKATRAG